MGLGVVALIRVRLGIVGFIRVHLVRSDARLRVVGFIQVPLVHSGAPRGIWVHLDLFSWA